MKSAGIQPTEETLFDNQERLDNSGGQDSDRQLNRKKSCYKVLTCDANDDIVVLQGSLMIGVAKQAALAHQAATDHYKDKTIGILTLAECTQLSKVANNLQDAEERIYHFCRIRIESEKEQERRVNIEEAKSEAHPDELHVSHRYDPEEEKTDIKPQS